jgi:diguanylate cyclase (GGDEF)-like protein/PAS domain S-box-containing protein
MHRGRQSRSDAKSVAKALATALNRPVVVAWCSAKGEPVVAIGHGVDQRDVDTVAAAIGEDGVRDVLGDDRWAVADAGGPDDRLVVVAIQRSSENDDTAVVELLAEAILAVLTRDHWDALEAEHQQLGFVLDNSADIICILRSDGTAEFITPSVERVLGWPEDHFLTNSAFDIVHPDDALLVTESLAATATAHGEGSTGRFRVRRADGEWAWIEARATIAPGRTDVAVVSAREVTDEVQARAEATMQEERYRRLVESSPQAIAIHQDGRFVFINQAGCRILGAPSPDEVIGLPVNLFSTTNPELSRQRIETLLAGRAIAPFESTVIRLDGTTVDLEITGIPTIWNDEPAVQIVAIDLSERRRAEALLEHAALHDPLTGLPNRNLLADRIDQAIRRAKRTGERSALLFCDLDKFKVVNDALGHTVGDELLLEVARRIRSGTRDTDTVARFGGDEFVVLTQDLDSDDDIAQLVDRIHSSLDEPFRVSGRTLHVRVSIGVVRITGEEIRDELLSFADSAMYVAKESGSNRWVMFDETLRTRASERLRIEGDLHAALTTGEALAVHLQPEVDLWTRQIVGFEALIRWTTPDGTTLPPDRFLPIAADAGLMPRVGAFMSDGVAQALTRLTQAQPSWWIALNASTDELEHPEFASQIQGALDRTNVDPSRLSIEITEHSIMRDPAGVEAALRPLRDRGVTIAIDDFGTGYSSLSYLAHFHPEFVKIDRSFTASILDQTTHRSIVEAVLHLADPLGIVTIAEGIETEEQAELLTQMGCRLGQGWLFGRPTESADAIQQALG